MPPQTLDPTSFPDQATPAQTGGAVDPTRFPDQPAAKKKVAAPKAQFLGDPTKEAHLKPGGGVLYESIPLVAGQAGAVAGGAAAAPTAATSGPVGPALGAVAGAGAGGILGRYIQRLLQETVGRTKFGQDYLGVPPPERGKSTLAQAGREAITQMETEMGGQIVAAPLGWIRRGGFLRLSRPAMTTLAENRALGTNLSGPEIATGTPLGNIGKTLQSYSAGSFGGAEIQRAAREKGTAAAVKAVDDALSLLGHPGITGGPTPTSAGSAAAARSFVGELLDKAADAAPSIDVTEVKRLAAQELEKGIVQHLKAVPDVADPKLANTIRQIRADPTLIQRLPRPELTRVADAILEKFKSPSMQLMRRIMGMEDQTAARGVWEELKSLRGRATPADQLYAKDDAQRLATLFRGKLRQNLSTAAPEFAQAMGQYRDLVRGDWLRSNIVLGGHPVPTNEAEANDVLTGMAERLRKATESGRLSRDFNDPQGKQVIQNLTRVANLMEKRSPVMSGNLRKIFEIGRIITAGAGLVSGHVAGGTAGAATLWEGFPDFFTWVIHDPKATRWFIEGVSAKNPTTSTGAIIRLSELYRRTHPKPQAPPKPGAQP